MPRPTLLVHGIWDSSARLEPLRAGLQARGVEPLEAMDLVPNNGRARLEVLAAQVAERALALREKHGSAQLDLVGFSMGAVVSRYFVQRLGGRECVRRFVSISGPQQGTLTALALPLAGVRQLRPGSELLRDLASDADPWGAVEVHCLYTPYDLMIVPARSGILPGARSVHALPVAMHRFMITDPRALSLTASLLLQE